MPPTRCAKLLRGNNFKHHQVLIPGSSASFMMYDTRPAENPVLAYPTPQVVLKLIGAGGVRTNDAVVVEANQRLSEGFPLTPKTIQISTGNVMMPLLSET
ncbi:hypothetical protein ACJ72_02542 [Emergomyces africanus]|uniref:Uncharacterized protein n=1 Tax=Emergomyces africanus TaxID=1955775 RepID=A0A1B7P250_9EURO|nr:hypothetical protein ACJ72_02542 [Emergomyces africanus]